MDWSKAFLIGLIDPGFDFYLESGRVHLVPVGDFAEGLEMLEVNLHLNKIVFKGSEMQKGGPVLVRHEGQV